MEPASITAARFDRGLRGNGHSDRGLGSSRAIEPEILAAAALGHSDHGSISGVLLEIPARKRLATVHSGHTPRRVAGRADILIGMATSFSCRGTGIGSFCRTVHPVSQTDPVAATCSP